MPTLTRPAAGPCADAWVSGWFLLRKNMRSPPLRPVGSPALPLIILIPRLRHGRVLCNRTGAFGWGGVEPSETARASGSSKMAAPVVRGPAPLRLLAPSAQPGGEGWLKRAG